MKQILSRFWSDESGFVGSSETVLLGTILTIGAICGLATVRDTVATEFGDLAASLIAMDQSYSYAAVVTDCGTVAGSVYIDRIDFCAPGLSDDDPPQRIGPIFIIPGQNFNIGDEQ